LTKLPEDIKCVSYPTSCVGSQNFTSNFSTQAIFGMVTFIHLAMCIDDSTNNEKNVFSQHCRTRSFEFDIGYHDDRVQCTVAYELMISFKNKTKNESSLSRVLKETQTWTHPQPHTHTHTNYNEPTFFIFHHTKMLCSLFVLFIYLF